MSWKALHWNSHSPEILSRIISWCMSFSLFVYTTPKTNWFSDKDGHVKLSDFGLSTGFHKQHDSNYYQRLLENGPPSNGAPQSARNSVMVNSINLTMTNKDQIATWKANRRKLVSLPAFPDVGAYTLNFCPRRPTQLSEHRITLHLKFSYKRVMGKSATGGHLVPSCSSAWLDIPHFVPKTRTKHTRR
jgi:hypothetical protein